MTRLALGGARDTGEGISAEQSVAQQQSRGSRWDPASNSKNLVFKSNSNSQPTSLKTKTKTKMKNRKPPGNGSAASDGRAAPPAPTRRTGAGLRSGAGGGA